MIKVCSRWCNFFASINNFLIVENALEFIDFSEHCIWNYGEKFRSSQTFSFSDLYSLTAEISSKLLSKLSHISHICQPHARAGY